MKKIMLALTLNVVVAGALLTSCQTKEQKVENAQQNVNESKQELKEAKRELNTEYPGFKRDAEEKIVANEKRITELREKISKSDKPVVNDMRRQRIEDLEKRNSDLRARLTDYENARTDWETFKEKYNHDVDKLNEAFRDFDKDLKK